MVDSPIAVPSTELTVTVAAVLGALSRTRLRVALLPSRTVLLCDSASN